MANQPPANPAEEDYNSLTALAERLQLEDDQREKFINSSMKRLGYKPRTQWEPPEPEDGGKGKDDDGDFFGGGKQQREQRQVRQERQGGSGSGGAGWQYDD